MEVDWTTRLKDKAVKLNKNVVPSYLDEANLKLKGCILVENKMIENYAIETINPKSYVLRSISVGLDFKAKSVLFTRDKVVCFNEKISIDEEETKL